MGVRPNGLKYSMGHCLRHRYARAVIAVTYIWYSGSQILETDTGLSTLFKWSLSGEARKMDAQNIMTHKFGHWCGLDKLYDDKDYSARVESCDRKGDG